mmetsp:Transcript_5654/g.13337  ORF Transcript_5654/g.13337 Transcript_5654/m.13337 type:complete len:211 (-) Transcript_5654:88-720(-)
MPASFPSSGAMKHTSSTDPSWKRTLGFTERSLSSFTSSNAGSLLLLLLLLLLLVLLLALMPLTQSAPRPPSSSTWQASSMSSMSCLGSNIGDTLCMAALPSLATKQTFTQARSDRAAPLLFPVLKRTLYTVKGVPCSLKAVCTLADPVPCCPSACLVRATESRSLRLLVSFRLVMATEGKTPGVLLGLRSSLLLCTATGLKFAPSKKPGR